MPICYWTLVSGDTWPVEKRNSRRVAELAGKAGGGVSLAHDFDRADDSVDEFVLKSLGAVLETAGRSGMKVMTLSELMSEKA